MLLTHCQLGGVQLNTVSSMVLGFDSKQSASSDSTLTNRVNAQHTDFEVRLQELCKASMLIYALLRFKLSCKSNT